MSHSVQEGGASQSSSPVDAGSLLSCGDPVDVPVEVSGHVEGAHQNHAWSAGDLRSFPAPAARAAHEVRVVLHQAGPHFPHSAADAARDLDSADAATTDSELLPADQHRRLVHPLRRDRQRPLPEPPVRRLRMHP